MVRVRRLLLASVLILASLVLSTSAGLAQATGVTPFSAPPGTEITVFGDGFQPGEMITIFFGGVEVVTFADDAGSFTTSLTIDALMPPGMHPMEISGDMGSFIDFEYRVDEPPPPTTTTTTATTTTTTQPPTTTSAPTTTTEGATTTTEGVTTTVAPTTTTVETTIPDTVPPTTIVDDSRVSSDGGGIPWWLFLVAILVALALGAGVMLAINSMKAGEFTDDQGNKWRICAARTCKAELGKQLNNKNLIRAVPKKPDEKCASGCKCVLFSWPKGKDASPSFEDEKGGWVLRNSKKRYKARCVEKV